jgi:hypothetical protein
MHPPRRCASGQQASDSDALIVEHIVDRPKIKIPRRIECHHQIEESQTTHARGPYEYVECHCTWLGEHFNP